MIAPGIGATFYGSLPTILDTHRDVIEASDLVCLHTSADASDVASAARVRALGCDRVWLAIPGNYIVSRATQRGIGPAVAEVERCARVARDMGVEVFEINGEGTSDGKKPGDWIPADPAEAARLASLAAAVIEAAKDVLGESARVSWTSHDMPGFRLPWNAILSRVDLHAPQHYPAMAGVVASQRSLASRIDRSRGRWEALAEAHTIPAEVVPGGSRWTPYLQGWGHTLGAMVWGLSQAPVARLWACPGSWSPDAVRALHGARLLRGAVGAGPHAVERFQVLHGLAADGVVGPRTLAAMGLS